MSVLDQIAKLAPNDKRHFEKRLQKNRESFQPDLAEKLTFAEMVSEELCDPFNRTPFRHWLYFIKRNYKEHPEVTPELFDEWQAEKASYKPNNRCVDYYTIPPTPADVARWHAETEKKRAAARAREVEAAEAAKRQAAEDNRCAALVAKLQAHEFEEIGLEPVDYMKLHALKKHPDKAKRDIARRWLEHFEAEPGDVQLAWQAYFGPVTIGTIPSLAGDDDDNDDDSDDNAEPQIVHLIPLPANQRDIYSESADAIEAGLLDPAFEDFRRFSTGVRRLLDLIGNPIDDLIVPSADAFHPKAAEDVDAIAAGDDDFADIVPGLIPRGLTVPHGNAKHCKSLLMQKVAVVVADDTGATFDGIEVEHGQVIYATLDPGAEARRIKPGIIEIRDRLGLNPSGRLHLTDAPLVLNEPASVAHWIELNKARLPCKLIIVDSLFAAAAGSLAQDDVVRGCMEGVRMLLRYSPAVVTPHHDNKQGDIFGSVFLKAMMASKIGVARNVLKDGSLGDQVMVKTEFLKFDDADLKLKYTLDGPYLDANARRDMPEGIKRPDIWALLPTSPIAVSDARKLIEHLLSARTPKAREMEWRRLRLHWVERGVVIVEDGTIRRFSHGRHPSTRNN